MRLKSRFRRPGVLVAVPILAALALDIAASPSFAGPATATAKREHPHSAKAWIGKALPPLTPEVWWTSADVRRMRFPNPEATPTPSAREPAVVPDTITVIHVGQGTECGPCIRARGALGRIAPRYAPRGVRFVELLELDLTKDPRAEATHEIELEKTPSLVPVGYGRSVGAWITRIDLDTVPATFIVGRNGKVVWADDGWGLETEEEFPKILERFLPKENASTGGLPDAVRRGRAKLLAAAKADEALLPIPEADADREALLARAIPSLERDVAILDAATGGLPPAEVLRLDCHFRNALDRAKAGAAIAFAPLPAELSPLAPDRLERRILLIAGLADAERARVLPKLTLATKVVLTLSGNRRREILLPHSGFIIDPAARSSDLDTFWNALASPEIRKGWFTGYDLREVWLLAARGRLADEDRYGGVRAARIRELAGIFQARYVYDEKPPSFESGDLLVYVLPWLTTNTVLVLRKPDVARLESDVDVVDLNAVGMNYGEAVSTSFKLSVDPPQLRVRRVRPGFAWLRPRVPAGFDAKKLLRPMPWPSGGFTWRPEPAQEPLRGVNGGLEPEALVRAFLDRAGGGFHWAGMPTDERLALTTWTETPQQDERVRIAAGYTLVGPSADSTDTEKHYAVVYDAPSALIDVNGGHFGSDDEHPIRVDLTVTKTEDGWKIARPTHSPDVLLLDRSRVAWNLPRNVAATDAAIGQALYDQKRWAESAGKFESAATALPKDADSAYNAACSYALAGNGDAALRWLGAAADRGFADAKHLSSDPDLGSLRALPAWQGIASRVQAAADAAAAKRSGAGGDGSGGDAR